ncbi:thioesterase [Bordetella pertussis]|nr:thioesterase [Bordetella pertussis]
MTANLTIHFLRKTSGAAVIADARVLKTGRLAMAEAILRCDGADEPVAHVVSAWAVPAP